MNPEEMAVERAVSVLQTAGFVPEGTAWTKPRTPRTRYRVTVGSAWIAVFLIDDGRPHRKQLVAEARTQDAQGLARLFGVTIPAFYPEHAA